MRKIYPIKLLLLFCLLCLALPVLAQQVKITGQVVSADNRQPLPGVTIHVKGSTTNGTTTDADGKYSIEATPGEALVFTFIGFNSKEIKTGGKTQVNVLLTPSAQSLKETVVIGYQQQNARTTTAAVTAISGKVIENLPAPSFDQLLQGRVSGVNIQNYTGEPGVRNTFVVRGNTNIAQGDPNSPSNINEAQALSAPLYVIDGVPTNLDDIATFDNTGTNFLAGINVNDIESIVVEKDAAATAAWGSRGANGVVIIKTKRGVSETPQFTVNLYTGVTEVPKLLPTVIGAEERRQKIDLLRNYGDYNQLSRIPQILTDSLNPAFNNATNWQGIFYRPGIVRNADVSMAAAHDNFNYRVSLNYYDEDGVIKSYGFTRYTVRGNFGFKISNKLSSDLNVSLARNDRKRGLGGSPYFDNVLPIDGPQMPASFYRLSKADSLNYTGQYDKLRDKNQNDNINGFFDLKYDIIPGLRYTFQGAVTSALNRRDYFSPMEINSSGTNQAESDNSTYNQYNLDNILSYAKTINGLHHIAITATQSFQRIETFYTKIGATNQPSDYVSTVVGAPPQYLYGNNQSNQFSDYAAGSLLSWVGQAQYDYKEKYILAATYRADASSRFGNKSKWGFFPAVSAAWVISDENFMKGLNWLNFLKIRGSFGKSGQEPLAFYGPYNDYRISSGNFDYTSNTNTQTLYNGVNIVTPNYNNGITKDSLTWSSSYQWDLGFDAFMIDNRINVNFDVYDRESKNGFYNWPLPFFTGFNKVYYNAPIGIRNSGLEVTILTHNMPSRDKFQWNTNFNLSFNHNEITSLPNGNQTFFDDYYDQNGNDLAFIYTVGKPVYQWNQILYRGVYNTASQIPVNPLTGAYLTYFKGNHTVKPGDPIWVDVNHDYDVWGDEDRGDPQGDRLPTGNPNPKITGGFNNDFSYKNWMLSVGCSFTLGRDIINTALADQFNTVFGGFYSPLGNALSSFAGLRIPDLRGLDYWVPAEGKNSPNSYHASFPSLNPFGGYYYQYFIFTTMFNENGSYFKINNIMLSYNLGQGVLNRLKLKGVRFYGVLDNVAIFQKASVPDAEQVNPFGVYSGTRYPIPKKLTVGVSLQF